MRRALLTLLVTGLLAGCASSYRTYYPEDSGYYYSDADGAYYSGASVYYEDGYYGGGSNVFFGVSYTSGPSWWPYYGPYWYGPHSGFFYNVGYYGPWYTGYVGYGYPWYSIAHIHHHHHHYRPYYGWPHYYWGYPGYHTDVRREVARVSRGRPSRLAGAGRVHDATTTPIVPKGGSSRGSGRVARSAAARDEIVTSRSGRDSTRSTRAYRGYRDQDARRAAAAGTDARVRSGASRDARGEVAELSRGAAVEPRAGAAADKPASRPPSRGRTAYREPGDGPSRGSATVPGRRVADQPAAVRGRVISAGRSADVKTTPVRRSRSGLRASAGGARKTPPPARSARSAPVYRGAPASARAPQRTHGPRTYPAGPPRAPVNTAAPPPNAVRAPAPQGDAGPSDRGSKSHGRSSRSSRSGSHGRSSERSRGSSSRSGRSRRP